MSFLQYINRTLNSSRSLILFVIFAGFFFVRTTLLPLSHDDYAYAFIWDGAHGGNLEAMQFGTPEVETRQRVESLNDIVRSMESHYFTWGGRIFAHGLAQFFIWIGKPVFDVANTIMFIFLVLTIINLANTWLKISRTALVWIFISLFLFAACSLTSMLWLTGSCNYMWMTFFQLFFLTPYVKALRSHEAGDSALNVVLMILLGLMAGWSNEAGSLVTVCLTLFLVVMCKARGVFRSWMIAGLAALVIGCAFMMLAPGNFARLEFAHPHFVYTEELFYEHLTEGFDRVVGADLLALIPMFVYFLRRKVGSLTTAEILMLAFATAGLLVPAAMLFSPEFNLRVSVPSLSFVLVASTSAILEAERQSLKFNFQLPQKFRRGVAMALTSILVAYFVTFIYVDISIFNAARRQVRHIERTSYLDPVPMPILPIRHRFEKIQGDRSAVPYLKFFAGINENPNFCLNMLVAQYYGVRHVVGVND